MERDNIAFIGDNRLGTTHSSSRVINKQTKGLELTLAVDSAPSIRSLGIVGEDANNGAIVNSVNSGSSLDNG